MEEQRGAFTNRDPREGQVGLCCQLALDVAVRLWIDLELRLEGFDLLLGQARPRQVLRVVLIFFDHGRGRRRVKLRHLVGRMGEQIPVRRVHHGRRRHRLITDGLLDGRGGMAAEGVWVM